MSNADNIEANQRANNTINIMVGTSPQGQGGMASVIRGYQQAGLFARHKVTFITTHHSKNQRKWQMLLTFGLGVLHLLFTGLRNKLGWAHIHLASKGSYLRKRWMIKLAKTLGAKVLIHLHGGGFADFYASQNEAGQHAIRQSFLAASRIIVLSKQTETWLTELISGQRPIQVLYNTVPRFEGNIHQRQTKRVLFLGNLIPAKGVYDLVHAFANIVADFPDAQLRMGGTGEAEQLQALINERQVSANITLLGWIGGAEKQQEIATADTFCLPSYHEQMPMSLLEAMSAHQAVIASNVGGIPDIIQHGHNGLLIDAGDIAQLEQALRDLFSQPDYAQQLAGQANRDFEQCFSEPVIMAQLDHAYASVATQPDIINDN